MDLENISGEGKELDMGVESPIANLSYSGYSLAVGLNPREQLHGILVNKCDLEVASSQNNIIHSLFN